MTDTPYVHAPRFPDYSILKTLQRGFLLLKDNRTAFDRLFPGIDQTVIDSFHSRLFSSTGSAEPDQIPSVVVVGQSGTPRFPGVVVSQENAQVTDMPLGAIIRYTDDNVPVYRYTCRWIISVESRASPRDLARALDVCVVAILANAQKVLYEEKYTAIYYVGTSGPTPEMAYIAEREGLGGITFFESSFRLEGDWDIPGFEQDFPPITDVLVLEKGLSLDGIPGGVAPSDL